ncbi:MAG: SAM-dependent methyltransferase [Candidatus Binatia bacterium]
MILLQDLEPEVHYDRVTPAWTLLMGPDLHYGYFGDGAGDLQQATRALTRRMATHGGIVPDLDILDVGCGTGGPACFLADEFCCRVHGISTSEVGLREARRQAEARGLRNRTKFTYGDGMDNRLPDSSFDCVWVLQASHFMKHKDRLVAESARVLRPGGRIVLGDIMLRAPLPMTELIKYREQFLLLHRVFGRAKMESIESYRSWATDSGLRVTVLEDASTETLPTFDCWRHNAREHRSRVVDLVGESLWRQFLEACDVLESFWKSQKLGYGLFAAVKEHSK